LPRRISRLVESLFFKNDDHTHTDHCHTDDMLLSSLSPPCTKRLGSISLYYTRACGIYSVFNCLTPAFFTSVVSKVVVLLRNGNCKGHHFNFYTNKKISTT
jgi:hypothetical protein